MNKVVLLVDDDTDLRELYRMAFEMVDFETIRACNGAEAIEILKQSLPDAVVLDISMPRVSGLKVIEYLREERSIADLPIVVVTAYPYLAETSVVSGATHTLMKPVAIQKLVSLVDSLVAEHVALS